MEQSQIILHGSSASEHAWRVRLALNLKSIQYEKKSSEEKDSMNLEINGKKLGQSMSVLEYLEETFPDAKNLLPKGGD